LATPEEHVDAVDSPTKINTPFNVEEIKQT
jgi:hypothetical protein